MKNNSELSELHRRVNELSVNCDIVVIDLFVELLNKIEQLDEEVKKLRGQLSKDSHNSNQPPSVDGFKKKLNGIRKKSDKKVGGQQGHKGETLKMSDKPDEVINHKVYKCCGCGERLCDVPIIKTEERQVFDIPVIKIKVTEHRIEVKKCNKCGAINTASFLNGIENVVQYGDNVKALVVYFNQYQLLPYERTTEILSDIFSHKVSAATLYNANANCYNQLEETENVIKQEIINSEVAHFDETDVYNNGKIDWLHVASTKKLTYYEINKNRGKSAMEQIGILPVYNGTAVHDHWASYENIIANMHFVMLII